MRRTAYFVVAVGLSAVLLSAQSESPRVKRSAERNVEAHGEEAAEHMAQKKRRAARLEKVKAGAKKKGAAKGKKGAARKKAATKGKKVAKGKKGAKRKLDARSGPDRKKPAANRRGPKAVGGRAMAKKGQKGGQCEQCGNAKKGARGDRRAGPDVRKDRRGRDAKALRAAAKSGDRRGFLNRTRSNAPARAFAAKRPIARKAAQRATRRARI